jgi:hypothetical protein
LEGVHFAADRRHRERLAERGRELLRRHRPDERGRRSLRPGNGTATASTDLISITGHGLAAGNQVIFTALTGGAGLTLQVPYYVIATGLTANVFSVSTKQGGTAVDITSNATALTAFKVTPPMEVLWSKAWDLPPDTTSTQLSAAAVAEGQKARAWLAARDAARAGVPVGTNVAVT